MPLAYSEVAPSPRLAPFVKCFWFLRGERDGPPVSERTLPDRIAALERLLLSRLHVPDRWQTADAAIALIVRRSVALRQLPAMTGRTGRTIERAFAECVGMTPKTFSRLVRLHAYLADPL